MTLPMFAAALDTAAVGAMVSVVGSYTLEALMDSELRAQHKERCAERLMMNDGRQVQYSDQAILANLDWGIDSLEEAIAATNEEMKIARLDHAEKMLQVCALLDFRATTAEIPNCYLSAWAHFNLAFVWKLRDNDRNAAHHMLEMFLVDPFYGRVDFAPALWEHLFLPHLLNIVTWYTKQRKSIVVSGTSRKMSEDLEMSMSMSRDFTSNANDVQVNVLNLSAGQTAQLQGLEKTYQDSLDENTRQYARYYKDWLNYDMANMKGKPLMPIAEPPMTPMTDSWVPPSFGMPPLPKDQEPASTGVTSSVAGPRLPRQEGISSLSRQCSESRTEFTDFVNPEFVESPDASASDHGDERIDIRSQRHIRSESLGSVHSTISNSATATPVMRPPKDFVCPITSQLFNDPVTLETGQTYERKAIQEWLNRGNVTCPITRQTLGINGLPKTNYVLKRLVDGWKEQYPELAIEFGCSPLVDDTATVRTGSEFAERSIPSISSVDSPGSGRQSRRFSRRGLSNNYERDRPASPVDVDGLVMDLKPALNHLCTSENLPECESVILEIARLVLQSCGDQKLVAILNKPGAIAAMMELLFNSEQVTVLDATLFLLSILVSKDDAARQAVISADPEVGCLLGLLKKGLTSSVSLLYHLKLPIQELALLDLLPLLVVVMKETEEDQGGDESTQEQDLHSLMMRPTSAAIILLDQIVSGGDQTTFTQNIQALLALQGVPNLLSSLEQAKRVDVRTSLVSLLLCCMQSDGRIRNTIAKMTNLGPVVDLLHSGNDRARKVAISFLNDLVHLNSRALSTSILQKVKADGSLSSMRVLLVYLQMAPLEDRPVAASLLLQLDLLEEPRKRSIYREEAVESLVEALTSADWPCPVRAATTLIALSGRFSYTGKPMMKAWLLKIAGVDKYYLSSMKDEQDSYSNERPSAFDLEEEEKAAKAWERRVAGALVGHELGTLIEALGQGIQSKISEVSKPCMVVATWLTHLLPKLPDTGIRQTARNCLLDHFVGVLQTSKDLQQRVLASLAIQSFISDPEGVEELLSYVKDVSGPLRHLKKTTWTAKEILRTFTIHVDVNSVDVWVHAEQGQLDNTENGEVRALARAKSRMFSGHSDGTIKVWDTKNRFPVQIQEQKEHTKSVTALTVALHTNRLYSGSLDKSIRVWAIGPEDIQHLHVFELKDAIVGLIVNGPMACIVPQGVGIRVQYEESATKILNSNKHVQSLAISEGKVFCGCADNSIQALDPISESLDVIQHGVRTLLGKKAIYATQVFQELLYVAGAPVDGVAGKVWKLSDYSLVGTLSTTSEVRSMAVSEDFIYLGSSSGTIEVWLRERLLRVSTLNAGSKVFSLMLDGDALYSASEDGKIRIWTMI